METAAQLLARGYSLYQAGDYAEAEASLRQVVESDPENATAWCGLGIVCRAQGKLAEAESSYRQALRLNSEFPEAYSNLGNVLWMQGDLEAAIDCYQQALRFNPHDANTHVNLGIALRDQGRLEKAQASFETAVQIAPSSAEAHYNLANVLKRLGTLDEAVAEYQKTLQLNPQFFEAHNNLGNALFGQGRAKWREAMACYEEALHINPDYAETHWNRSLLFLLRGDFAQGWPEYEWRWKRDKSESLGTKPSGKAWDGTSLNGRTILLYAEQGLGDTLQFVRFAKLVKRFGGTVMAQVQPEICRLLGQVEGVDELFGRGQQLPQYDVHASFMSLPGMLGTRLETIPAEVPYLAAEEGLIEKWKPRLADLRGLKIGLAWQGTTMHERDKDRSVPLRSLAPLLEIAGVSFVSLQKGYGEEQIGESGFENRIMHFMEDVDDFADTAAIVEQLGLVITVDTSVAHLAGAMGKPTWVLLPFVPDWRWMLDREDSPWYPTMRLFRQQTRGDWDEVIDRVASALSALVRTQPT